MSDNLKERLDEVHRNIRLTKRQIKKAKNGGYQTLPGMDYSFESPCWATLVLEDQLRDLQIQEADIKRQMEEEGVLVNAVENPQMMLYALGALRIFDCLYNITEVSMTIYQPRRENVSTWTISVEELNDWAEQTLKPKAELAFKGEGEYSPGAWCQFCKAAVKCRARAEAKLQLAKYEFAKPPLLTDAEIGDILGKLDDLTKWANEIIAYAQDAAVSHGKQWPGYKLVESRTNRKYTDEDAVIKAARSAGYTDIFKKSLIPITEMEKLMGKKTFAEVLGSLVIKPQGKPTLVPASDKRPAITTTGAKQDFSDYKGD